MSEMEIQTKESEKYLENVHKYQELVDELMKSQPDEQHVKKLMKNLDLEYNTEPIERLNLVLRALHR